MNLKRSFAIGLILALTTPNLRASGEESPWTTWSKKTFLLGLIELMNIRTNLMKSNLFSTDEEPSTVPDCDPMRRFARSADGTCNDLARPLMGAARTRFGRNVPLASAFPDEARLMIPNPREISLKLLTRKTFRPLPNVNLLAAAWVQFMIHDWVNHESAAYSSENLHAIPLADGDPWGTGTMFVPKAKRDPVRSRDGKIPPAYLNTATHWWDGSQLYGNDQATQDQLRSFVDGKLAMTSDGHLPLDSSGVEKTGVTANWWLGLSLMHHLFAREHNAIAERLKVAHPDWNDQKLFDTARLVNAALMAKIQVTEWVGNTNRNKVIQFGQKTSWSGVAGLGSYAAGIVGGPTKLRNVPYSLTEEFVSAYRFHPLLPEFVDVVHLSGRGANERIPLAETRGANSHELTDRTSMADLLFSFGRAHAGAQVLRNYPTFLQNLEMPVLGKMDLAAVEILRDRERGVPRYNEFRRLLQLKPIRNFEELTSDRETVNTLKEVYRGDVELLDLMVGTYAEEPRPDGLGFGETFFQVFIMMTPRRLEADRFFTTDYRPEVYSEEGLRWVEKNNLKSVLLRHYPELASRLKNVSTPFTPWDD